MCANVDGKKLIAEVRKHPILYDPNIQAYKDTESKNDVWTKIAIRLTNKDDIKSVALVKAKWKNLRDTFVKTQKLLSGEKSRNKKRLWRHTFQMKFIAPYLQERHPSFLEHDAVFGEHSSIASNHGSHTGTGEEDSCGVEELLPADDMSDYSSSHEQQPQEQAFMNPVVTYVNADDTVDQALAFLKERHHTTAHVPPIVDSDIDSFFKGISETVKRLKPINQVKVQREVVNLVLDYKLRETEESESLVF